MMVVGLWGKVSFFFGEREVRDGGKVRFKF